MISSTPVNLSPNSLFSNKEYEIKLAEEDPPCLDFQLPRSRQAEEEEGLISQRPKITTVVSTLIL
jgi:hypothetical protein